MIKHGYGFDEIKIMSNEWRFKPIIRRELMKYDVKERIFITDVIRYFHDMKLFFMHDNLEVYFSKNDRRLLITRKVVGKVGRYHMKVNGISYGYNAWIVFKEGV